MLEVCIDSLESAKNAIDAGADEIEVCSALNDAGLTPSIGLVHEVLALVKKLPAASRPKVNAMIRCIGDRFFYNDMDMEEMICDMNVMKEIGVHGFVFGALTAANEVDESKCIQFLNAAAPNKVTFSRAFDYTVESKKSAAIIYGLGFSRILTSGHRAHVSIEGAVEDIDYLTSRYSSGTEQMVIMPGGGVTSRNVETFIDIGCIIVHSSCKTAIQLPDNNRSNNEELSDNDCVYITDSDLVREMKEAITRAKEENEQIDKCDKT